MPVLRDSDDRPALLEYEIEVTPEMIEAGARALLDDGGLAECLSPTIAEIVSEAVLRAGLLSEKRDRK